MDQFDWKAWRTQVKRQIDIRDLIGQATILSQGMPADGLCPFHQERTPSFKVWQDHYHCYGCETHGDVFTWLETIGGFSKEQSLTQAARISGVALPTQPKAQNTKQQTQPSSPLPVRSPPMWIAEFVEQAHQALMKGESAAAQQTWNYLEQRGLAGVAQMLKFGVADRSVRVPQMGAKLDTLLGRLIIPTLVDNQAVFFKARYLALAEIDLKQQGIMKYDGPTGQMPAPFHGDVLHRAISRGFVLLTEGELDAASVIMACGDDFPVLGLPGGRLPQGWDGRIAEAGVRVYLLMDSDEAGERHALSIKTSLEALKVRVSKLELPKYNDLNAALIELGSDGLEQLLDELRCDVDRHAISDWSYIHSTFFDEVDARFHRPHRSYSTGLGGLDAALDGGFAEGLHILGGITGGGKTSLSLSIAIHNAQAGRSVLYASFEQSRYELWARIASRLTHVSQGAIKRGAFVHEDGSSEPVTQLLKNSGRWESVELVAKHLRILEGGDALSRNSGAWSIEAIRQAAELMTQTNGVPPLVIVDYLQRVPGPSDLRINDPRERISYVAGALQVRLGRELGCPVLALSSISRASYRLAESDTEARLAAFKEAGELEYTAYTAMLLYGLPLEHQDSLGFGKRRFAGAVLEKPIAIDLVKNREGSTGRFVASWHPRGDLWREIGIWNEASAPQALALSSR
jgi:replicative DNA helicase